MVNKNIIVTLFVTAAAAAPETGAAQKAAYNTPGAGNPILPGYFADPTIKKFGDTYYIYATTDGSGAGFGPAQLWCSKDFKNWTLMPMNWPDSHWIWAPDVMQNEADGKYYYLYCQPCKLHLGVGDTPRGPWKNVLGESEAVLVEDRFVKNAITLDGQTFRDDDGSVYMYWGTWGIYKGFGCGAGKLNPDMKSFSETKLIPNTEVTHFFEAPFVFKRNGIYYFLYSCEHCEDASYRVDYATAKSPLGPYTYHALSSRPMPTEPFTVRDTTACCRKATTTTSYIIATTIRIPIVDSIVRWQSINSNSMPTAPSRRSFQRTKAST